MAKSAPTRRSRRALAIAALLGAVLAVVFAAMATLGSAPTPASKAASGTHRPPVHHARGNASKTSSSSSRTAASTTPSAEAPVGAPTTPTTSPSSPPVTKIPAAAAPPVGGTGQASTALEDEGHQLMLAGNYQAAIPVLRRAVATADPSSLTYAFALYDLGRSLRLSGDPQAAIPILQKRLEIPNQTDVVRAELDAAIREASKQ